MASLEKYGNKCAMVLIAVKPAIQVAIRQALCQRETEILSDVFQFLRRKVFHAFSTLLHVALASELGPVDKQTQLKKIHSFIWTQSLDNFHVRQSKDAPSLIQISQLLRTRF